MSDPVLSVSGLRFSYPGKAEPVLRDISFQVLPGEVVGVLGPNGSGKSTLLSALLDMRRGRREGELGFFGERGLDRRRVGFATQQLALYDKLTARENLVLSARLLVPPGRVAAAVDASIAEFGIAEVAAEPVHRLSGGWQRLVHLAVSFVHDPPLRFLDEPTTALDFEARERLVRLVGDWRSRSIATLLTSHYPEDIEEMCQRILVIRSGEVVRSTGLAELLAGVSRQLVVEGTCDGRPVSGRADAPATLADLPGSVAKALDDCGADGARLTGVRLTSASLRGLLSEDPRLQEVLADAG